MYCSPTQHVGYVISALKNQATRRLLVLLRLTSCTPIVTACILIFLVMTCCPIATPSFAVSCIFNNFLVEVFGHHEPMNSGVGLTLRPFN